MKAKVFERTLRITEAETLVAGSVNQYVIDFTFDEAWLDYACEAVFKREDGTIKEVLIVGGLAVIPWEAVQEPGYLVIGVYGTKDDQIRPTVWASPIQVHAGAAQGDPAIDYETTPWQDALTRMGALAQETVDAQAAAEAAQEAAETAQSAAEGSATAAAGSATEANAAKAAAENAATAACGAATAAGTARTAAETAQGAAESAAAAAGQAQTAAGQAATQAGQAATAAAGAATDAETAKEAAEQSEQHTEQMAETIQSALDAVAQETTAQTISGLVAQITALVRQIAEEGGSAGDLNGFSLARGAGNEVILAYVNPEDETDTGSAVLPTGTTQSEMLAVMREITNSLEIWAGGAE